MSDNSGVTVYVTSYCAYCEMAKRHLRKLGVHYETIDVTRDAQKRMELVQKTGMRTVPQIFIGDTSIGGYTDMAKLDRDGELKPMLVAAGLMPA